MRVHLLAREGLGARECRFRPARVPVMPVGHEQRVIKARFAVLEFDLPDAVLAAGSMAHAGLEGDLLAKAEMVDVVFEVGRDLRVVGEVRVCLGHREVRVLHARSRGVDEQVAIGRGHAVLVGEHPVAADAVGLLQAVERDRTLVQRLGGGDTGGAGADDARPRQPLRARPPVFKRLAHQAPSLEERPGTGCASPRRRCPDWRASAAPRGLRRRRRGRRGPRRSHDPARGVLSVALPGQIALDDARALASLVDRPHDQRLPRRASPALNTPSCELE